MGKNLNLLLFWENYENSTSPLYNGGEVVEWFQPCNTTEKVVFTEFQKHLINL